MEMKINNVSFEFNSVHCKHFLWLFFIFIKIKLLFQYAWVLFNELFNLYIYLKTHV